MGTEVSSCKKIRIGILTTILDDWGGSEELWGRSIPYLQQLGYEILVFKNKLNLEHREFSALRRNNVKLIQLIPDENLFHRIKNLSKKALQKLFKLHIEDNWFKNLKKNKPDFVIISQGINFDGLYQAKQCVELSIPFVLISQKAVDFYWPPASERQFMTEVLGKARAIFFVSHHNKRLTEEQFGVRLPHSKVIFNPVKVSGSPIPYPSVGNGIKLACVARLFLIDKGQDMLIRILSKQKWKSRPITVSFIGTGSDCEGLKSMANLLNADNVVFKGQVDDIENLWREYHALILPARSEGLPLSVVEAMAAGRPVIVTKAGGIAEIVQDEVTGFISQVSEESFEEAMERAWNKREQWSAMGEMASANIKRIIPRSPEKEFAKSINEIVNE